MLLPDRSGVNVEVVQPSAVVLTPEAEVLDWDRRTMHAGRRVYECANLTVGMICSSTAAHGLGLFSSADEPCFEDELPVVLPVSVSHGTKQDYNEFMSSVEVAYARYLRFVYRGMSTDDARAVLPGCVAIRLVVGGNLVQWRSAWAERDRDIRPKEMRQLLFDVRSWVRVRQPWAVESV